MDILICLSSILNRNLERVRKDCKALQDIQGF